MSSMSNVKHELSQETRVEVKILIFKEKMLD